MSTRRTIWRIARWLLVLLVVVAVALYFVLPTAMGVAAVFPAAAEVGPPPDGFASVMLQTVDDLRLAAWYAAPANGAAIILLHGAGGSREALRDYGEFLVANGFGVLAVDMRGQ